VLELSREKSLIAERSEMKGNSGHTSKTNFGSDICEFESFCPSQPVPSLQAIPLGKEPASTQTDH
jgi:hypothetical protein